jgi:hypothetical protein
MTSGSCYRASAWRAQITPLPAVTPMLRVAQPLLINGCFSRSAVLALSKYTTVLSVLSSIAANYDNNHSFVVGKITVCLEIKYTRIWYGKI